jgi:hypothetical protein
MDEGGVERRAERRIRELERSTFALHLDFHRSSRVPRYCAVALTAGRTIT